MEESSLIVAFSAALIAGGPAYRYGGRFIANVWLRVLLAGGLAWILAFSFGRPVNLLLRAGKLLGRML